MPKELADVRIDLAKLSQQDTHIDPLGSTEVGRKYDYDRRFIIAVEEVSKEDQALDEENDEATGKNGIYVVALEDHESVMAPSRDLSDRLGRLAISAFLILLSVAIGMWLLVTRIFRASRRRLVGLSVDGPMGTLGSGAASTTAGTSVATDRGSESVNKTN